MASFDPCHNDSFYKSSIVRLAFVYLYLLVHSFASRTDSGEIYIFWRLVQKDKIREVKAFVSPHLTHISAACTKANSLT